MKNKIIHKRTSENPKQIVIGIVVSLLTSVMLILAFHPYNQWYLAFVALVPMLAAEHRILPRKWSGLAPAIGVGGWLFVFLSGMFGGSNAGKVIQIIVLVVIIIQIFTVPGIIRFHEQTGYRWLVLHGIADWVGFEMVRNFIPPINTHAFIAQTMYTQPFMLQPISIFSIYGLGMLIILTNFVTVQWILFLINRKTLSREDRSSKKRIALQWLAIGVAVLILWSGISLIILTSRPDNPEKIRVAAVQHNFPRPGHKDTPESQTKRVEELSRQTRIAAGQGAQLVVMPELGLGFDPQVEYSGEFKALAKETGAYLLIGYGVDDPRGWRNEMVMLTPEGEFLQVYGKNHPTSPGEPPIITSGVYPVYDTKIGKLATIICNDMHFTDTSRKLARKGAQLIAMPTLEVPGIAIEQVAQATLRAVENRVAAVKADVAYVSAIIDPYGKAISFRNGSPDGAAFALVADVELGTRSTFYNKTGDWPGWICLAGLIFFIILQNFKRKKLI